jgi:hypothetical protein
MQKVPINIKFNCEIISIKFKKVIERVGKRYLGKIKKTISKIVSEKYAIKIKGSQKSIKSLLKDYQQVY